MARAARCVAFAWVLLAAVGAAEAQQEGQGGQRQGQGGQGGEGGARRLDLSGRVELARLVDLASARLGLNIEYDESALRGASRCGWGGRSRMMSCGSW
jgi:hypothetical protein